jgi:hypothetical protein
MAAIAARLEYLNEHHVPDRHAWMSFEGASNFEDWVKRNQQELALPRSLREALCHDLRLLRLHLQDLDAEARRLSYQSGRGADVATTEMFVRDARTLALHDHESGTLDRQMLAAVRRDAERGLARWVAAVDQDPSTKNLKGAFAFIRERVPLGLDGDTVRRGLTSLGNGVAKRMRFAEARFRAQPTVANLEQYLGTVRTYAALGGETPISRPPAMKRLRSEGSYAVKTGDTLTAISKLFYGSEGYWEFILFANLKAIGKDPGRLRPGTELAIP